MALMTLSVNFTPAVTGGTVTVTADTLTEAKSKINTELSNRLNAQNAAAAALQTALNGVNS